MLNLQYSHFYKNKWLNDGLNAVSCCMGDTVTQLGKQQSVSDTLSHTTGRCWWRSEHIFLFTFYDVATYEIQQNQSEEKIIQYGVPQDSILGPLLLLIYFNHIHTTISNDTHIKLTLFADDTSIVITSNDRGGLTFNLHRNSGSILP